MTLSMIVRHSLFVAALLPLVFGYAPSASADDPAASVGIKYRVIVAPFEDKADHTWYHGQGVGDGMTDILITALHKSGRFRIFERAAMDQILGEKGMSLSDLANPSVEAAKKLEIGDFLVKATVTEFGYKEQEIGGSIAKSLFGKSPVSAGATKYIGRIGISLRIIDIGSGEIVLAEDVNAEDTSTSIGLSTSDFSFGDTKTFDDHIVGKATHKAIQLIVDKVAAQTSLKPWSGILIVAGELLFIDAEDNIGIVPGMVFDVRRLVQEIEHPRTHEIIKRLYADVGVVRATEIDVKATTVEIVSGEGFETGDEVRLKME
ncbi:MAG: hypothetical protein KAY32_09780 [Candidatus Eisenbacteria sp.]|nr:hypothetical protein [Candidatus Eisenbacteria bacterium]